MIIKHLITGQLIYIAIVLIVVFGVLPLLLSEGSEHYKVAVKDEFLTCAALLSLPALIFWAFW